MVRVIRYFVIVERRGGGRGSLVVSASHTEFRSMVFIPHW